MYKRDHESEISFPLIAPKIKAKRIINTRSSIANTIVITLFFKKVGQAGELQPCMVSTSTKHKLKSMNIKKKLIFYVVAFLKNFQGYVPATVNLLLSNLPRTTNPTSLVAA